MKHRHETQTLTEASTARPRKSNPSEGERQAMRKGIFTNRTGSQRGITGLETAIILIAFTVVGSVFAYTILSAGLFSSEKNKEAISKALEL